MATPVSDVEENGLVRALQDHVEAQRPMSLVGPVGNHRGATLARRRIQHHIVGVERLIGKVDSRNEALQQPARKNRNIDVRSLEFTAWTGHWSRFDGLKPILE